MTHSHNKAYGLYGKISADLHPRGKPQDSLHRIKKVSERISKHTFSLMTKSQLVKPRNWKERPDKMPYKRISGSRE
jgi:hypothetical protein